jgi:serine protease Do
VSPRPLTELRTQILGGSYVGLTVRDAEAADVERAGLPQAAGAVVEEVRGDSPAARAGLRAGDVITQFDGERVRSARHFDRLVSETPDGREVGITVVRSGETVALKVTPEEAPSVVALESLRGLRDLELRSIPELRDFEFRMPENFTVTVPRIEVDSLPRIVTMRGRLGVGVQEMTDQLAEYFGAAGGVLVTSVEDETPAKAAGLKAGDVITKINGEAVGTASELRRRLDQASGEVTITLIRDRREQTITADLGERESRTVRRIIR